MHTLVQEHKHTHTEQKVHRKVILLGSVWGFCPPSSTRMQGDFYISNWHDAIHVFYVHIYRYI